MTKDGPLAMEKIKGWQNQLHSELKGLADGRIERLNGFYKALSY